MAALLLFAASAGIAHAQSDRSTGRSNHQTVAYADVVRLLKAGTAEDDILEQVRRSPTVFVLDAKQVEELKALGASQRLLEALKGARASDGDKAVELANLAIVLDSSLSMKERTPEGQTKMEAAQNAVGELIAAIPDGLHVTFVVYGHDKAEGCKAVKVSRPMSELDQKGRAELRSMVSSLKPAGNTPIALALETAGTELGRDDGPGGIVLITDGVETCHGDPAAVAAALAKGGRMAFGVNVVGFGLKDNEHAAVEAIAKAGGGSFYDAASAGELAGALKKVGGELKKAAVPKQRVTRQYAAAGKRVEPGAFLNDAPTVQPGEYKGNLAMMQADYYQIPVRKGQELRAIGVIQKGAFQAGNDSVAQGFVVAIYTQALTMAAREGIEVKGNPTTPVTVRATWTADADQIAYVGISASHNLGGTSVIGEPKRSTYTLRLKVEGEASESSGDSPAPTGRMQAPAGSGFDDAGELKGTGIVGGDLKIGEVAFFKVPVQKGAALRVGSAFAKPFYHASNNSVAASYTLTLYDDDQVQVAQKQVEMSDNPAEAACMDVEWTATLSGHAYISLSAENSGMSIYGDEPKPGRFSVQITNGR